MSMGRLWLTHVLATCEAGRLCQGEGEGEEGGKRERERVGRGHRQTTQHHADGAVEERRSRAYPVPMGVFSALTHSFLCLGQCFRWHSTEQYLLNINKCVCVGRRHQRQHATRARTYRTVLHAEHTLNLW